MHDQALPNDPFTVALELVDVLETANLPCAVGGALCSGIWGWVRATRDVDLYVFVGEERYRELFEVLQRAGCEVDLEGCLHKAREGDVAVLSRNGWRVDVFVPSIPFYQQAQDSVRRVEILGKSVPFLSPEALCVFKLLFFREKDLYDLKRLVAVQQDDLDHGWVRTHIVAMMGEADPRTASWDNIVRTHGPQSVVPDP